MGFLSLIEHYIDVIFVVSMIICTILGGGAFYLFKVKKITAKEEKVNYAMFNRADATEYVKFENIVADGDGQMDGAGMIVLGNGVFVGGIAITGYNYSSASVEERQRTMINAIQFFNVVEEPIQMRQTVKAIELTRSIDEHVEYYKKIKGEWAELDEKVQEAEILADDYMDEPESYRSIMSRLAELKRMRAAKKFEMDEADVLVRYMRGLTVNSKDTTKINQIMFTYVFNPNDYTEQLTEEEIYIHAFQEISTKARKYGDAIARCGCTYERLTAEDLVGLLRKHSSPMSADEVSLSELFNSSYNELFVSSDSLYELEKERLGEEEHKKRMREYKENEIAVAKKARINANREGRIVMENVKEAVANEREQTTEM